MRGQANVDLDEDEKLQGRGV
jgi:hypothetical protein